MWISSNSTLFKCFCNQNLLAFATALSYSVVACLLPQDIIPIVKHHHEKYDGTGYPGKLKGEDIPYLARIAAIADTFDAMTSKRSYRDSLPMDVVISEFERCKGTQFDPKLDDVFLDILKNHYDEIEKIRENY